MAQRKKIVAIMFTSLANYQKLVKEDSKLALDLLNEHDKILSKIISGNKKKEKHTVSWVNYHYLIKMN